MAGESAADLPEYLLKPSLFGAHYSITLADRVRGTPLSEHSTAKLQALGWRPTGPGRQARERADDLGIAIPSTTERSWPVHKFQDFLKGSDHYFTTSSRGKPEKSSTFSRGTRALLTPKMRKDEGKLRSKY